MLESVRSSSSGPASAMNQASTAATADATSVEMRASCAGPAISAGMRFAGRRAGGRAGGNVRAMLPSYPCDGADGLLLSLTMSPILPSTPLRT